MKTVYRNFISRIKISKIGIPICSSLFFFLLCIGSFPALASTPNTGDKAINQPSISNAGSIAASLYQEFKVTGTITDNEGVPLAGASVVEKGTSNGTQSDFDGNYSLTLSDQNAVLVFTYLGYGVEEVSLDGRDLVSVSLEQSASNLEEVVVVGYGTQSRKDLTGSVGVVDGAEIESRSTTNISNALQGSVAGVTITRNGSQPGAGNSILVRGITTLEGNGSPLILVDNVPVNSIDDVNPDQVESISVLKDGAASAIYGSRAAAGVIIVTTKRAKAGVFSVGYTGENIINTPTEVRSTVRAVRYMQMDNEKSWNDNGNDDNQFPIWPENLISNYPSLSAQNPDFNPNTNWKDLILKKSSTGYRHNITLSGGTDKVKTNVNLGYEYQDALYDHRDWKRYTTRVNNDIKISDKFGGSIDIAFKLTKVDQPIIDPTGDAINTSPLYPALWQDGRISDGLTNPYARIQFGGFQASDSYLFYGMASVYYKPIEDLKLSLNLAPNFEFNKYKRFNKAIPFWAADDPERLNPPGYVGGHNINQIGLIEQRVNNNTLTTQALINYDKVFERHSVSVVMGYEEFSAKYENLNVEGQQFLSNDYPFLNQAPLDGVFDNGSSYTDNAYASYFGRLDYNFNNKYYVQGTIRGDGSSRFSSDYRWGTFPSVSAGWVLSNEGFMESLDPTLSFLKIRASYGSLGNDRLGNYLYQSVLQFANGLIANGSDVEAIRAAAERYLAIQDVTWETTISQNVGIDLNLFNDRFSLIADYYKKETTDMLLDLSIPSISGYEDPTSNVGSMNTEGWELSASWRDQIGKFRYSTSFNIFDSKSTIGDIGGKRLFGFGGRFLSEEGSQYRSWYGYQSDGIFQTQAEVDASALTNENVGPGDIKYRDISGPDDTPDGVINEFDRTNLGGSLPRYQYGGTINLGYKNFDFGISFQGVGEQKFYLSQDFIRPFLATYRSPSTVYENNYWSNYNTPQQNQNARYPRLTENSAGNNYAFSDHWLVDGSYFRIKNLTVGYTLPSDIFGGDKISKLRIYLSGNDIFKIDSLINGLDPEQNFESNGYLITQSFILGLKANF